MPTEPTRLASDPIIEEMFRSPIVGDRSQHLARSARDVRIDGHWLEFGTATGGTLKILAAQRAPEPVYGFDSFEGLPEEWRHSNRAVQRKGTFACPPPDDLPDNAHLVVGLFEDTLPDWLSENPGPVAMLHIDCDLYSSASCVLSHCNTRIVPGTIIRFDDIAQWDSYQNGGQTGYAYWRQGEYRALMQWMAAGDRQIEVLHRARRWGATIRVIR